MIPFNSIVLFGLAIFMLIVLLRTIKIVPQKQVKIIERLGKYHRTAEAGLNTIVPFLDSVRDGSPCPPTRSSSRARSTTIDTVITTTNEPICVGIR